MKSKKNIYYVDGGTKYNGMKYQSSVICVTDYLGRCLADEHIGNKTNNEAELTAVLRALDLAKDNNPQIFSDSLLTVRLLQRKYRTKIDRLLNIIKKINSHKKMFTITWIPRERNKAGFIIEQKYGL